MELKVIELTIDNSPFTLLKRCIYQPVIAKTNGGIFIVFWQAFIKPEINAVFTAIIPVINNTVFTKPFIGLSASFFLFKFALFIHISKRNFIIC